MIQVSSNITADNIQISIDSDTFSDGGYGTFEDLAAGEYTLTYTDLSRVGPNGLNCSTTQVIRVSQPEALFLESDPNFLVTPVLCPDSCNGAINISNLLVSNPQLTASITPPVPNNTEAYSDLCEGTYIVTITNDSGCQQDTTILINEPEDISLVCNVFNPCNELENGFVICSATGGTLPYTYFLSSEFNDTGEFQELPPGTYISSIIDANGCHFQLVEDIAIIEPEQLLIEELSLTSPNCNGECTAIASILITGGAPPYSYSWNESPFTPDLLTNNTLCAGMNTLHISDQNNCVADTIFQINQPLPIEASINVSNVTCSGMCNGGFLLHITGQEPLIIDYENLSPTVEPNELCEGIYPFIVTDALGCILHDTVIVDTHFVSDLHYTVSTTPVSCSSNSDGSATIDVSGGIGIISYQWSDTNSQMTPTAIGLKKDVYTFTIMDELGCTYTDQLSIEDIEGCLFVTNAFTPNGDDFNDKWIIKGLEHFPNAQIEVFNRWGQRVFRSVGECNWDGTYNSQRLPIADYYYTISYASDSPPLTGTVTIKY